MKKILVIHGPNLNLLGERETNIYGRETLGSINLQIAQKAESRGINCEIFQSNSEGALIDKLHEARKTCDASSSTQAPTPTIVMPSGMPSLPLRSRWWRCTARTSTPERNSGTSR